MPLNPSRGETSLFRLLIGVKGSFRTRADASSFGCVLVDSRQTQETSTSEHSEAREDWQLSRRRVCSSSAAQATARRAAES